MALADADVMRVRDLIAAARRQNRSIAYITYLLYKTANGLYHAKGYTEKDGDLAYLILKVGGGVLCCSQLYIKLGIYLVLSGFTNIWKRSHPP